MKNFTKLLLLFLLSTTLGGCTFSFLAGRNQKITIQKDSLATIRVSDTLPRMASNKYVFRRDWSQLQLKISKPGYKDEYRAAIPYRLSPLGYGTIALNIVAAMIPASAIYSNIQRDFTETGGSQVFLGLGLGLGTAAGFFYCMDPKLWNYDSKINLDIPMLKIVKRDSTMKELYLNNVAFNVSRTDMKFQTLTNPSKYYQNKIPQNWTSSTKNGLKIDNSVFSDEINKILRKNGFIDTSGLVLKGGYKENLYVNTTITSLKVLQVYSFGKLTGFTKLLLSTKWDILDIYKNIIYSDTLELSSGEFTGSDYNDSFYKKIVEDALETGIYTLMNTKKFQNVIHIEQQKETDNLQNISLPKSDKYVSSLEEAINATITIKTKSGHGSGFIISENGFIITNYHVVSDTTKLEISLNDGTIHKANLIQFNKENDLALLKIDVNGLLPFAIPEKDNINIGKEIYVIGTPSAQDLSQTLTKGIISSIRKQADGSKIIQTDASVNRGNSGGSLVDKNGMLIGVVNAKLIGVGIEGISFAIPAGKIKTALKISFK